MPLLQNLKYLLPFSTNRFNLKNLFSRILFASIILYICASTIFIINNVNNSKSQKYTTNYQREYNNEYVDATRYRPQSLNNPGTSAFENKRCGYEYCNLGKKDKLNVHLISHTHDDVGWIKTVSEYYYDTVQFILETVSSELESDTKKRFIYVEMAFFYPWWITLEKSKKQLVHKLVDLGQLEFILGGWSMNDEASTHYSAIIDQHTVGFDFLKSTFGECGIPKIGWQVDPFGHSREQASLFAQFGFDAFINSRIDWQDYHKRLNEKNLEDMWYGSDSLDDGSPIYSHSLYRQTYSHADDFCFECGIRIKDNPEMNDFNADEFLDNFIQHVHQQRNFFKTNHVMVMMGGDFEYQNAKINFKNIDILLKHLRKMEDEGLDLHVFYSTPSCYVKAVNEAGIELQTYHGDYFPYSSTTDFYWTGYYTSRPSLKLYERQANSFLQVCKQVQTFAQLHNDTEALHKLAKLKRALGVIQHHDAITGTSKRYVANVYSQMLSDGIASCEDVVERGLNRLMSTGTSTPLAFQYCHHLNASVCEATESFNKFVMLVYNPMGFPLSHHVRLPVVAENFKVFDHKLIAVPWELSEVTETTKKSFAYKLNGQARYQLVFKTLLPPLGFTTYYVSVSKEPPASTPLPYTFKFSYEEEITIKNEYLELTFSGNTGLLKSVHNVEKGIKVQATQHVLSYEPMAQMGANSGAYVFHPTGEAYYVNKDSVTSTVVMGELVQEVHQRFSQTASLVVRLYKGARHFESEWTVSPFESKAMEYIVRFETSLNSKEVFFTDANGRQMMKRVRNYRSSWELKTQDTISSNYYPITNRIFIQDEEKNVQMTVMSDRAQGASSLKSGEIELMIDRHLFYDDGLGVDEALNDYESDGTVQVVRGTHYITLDTIEASTRLHRTMSQMLVYQPFLSFIPQQSADTLANQYINHWKGLKIKSLPDKVHLLTLEPWHHNGLLLRLEHYWERHEVAKTNASVAVSVADLFTPFRVTSLREQALGGNQDIVQVNRLQWKVKGKNPTSAKIDEHMEKIRDRGLVVLLKAMQIRTFVVTISARP